MNPFSAIEYDFKQLHSAILLQSMCNGKAPCKFNLVYELTKLSIWRIAQNK